jgi:hypothetical protein
VGQPFFFYTRCIKSTNLFFERNLDDSIDNFNIFAPQLQVQIPKYPDNYRDWKLFFSRPARTSGGAAGTRIQNLIFKKLRNGITMWNRGAAKCREVNFV